MNNHHKVHTDLELLFKQMTHQNDVKSFEYLFDQFFAPLVCYANRYIDSLEICEDIVQEFFFKIWKKRAELIIKSSVRNFLVTGVKNSCIDYLRRKETESHYLKREINAIVNEGETQSIEIDLSENKSQLKPGEQYYFRVGALIDAPEAKCNYAPAVKI